jgi:hypothetical protein
MRILQGTKHLFGATSAGDDLSLHRDRESVRSYGGKEKVFTNSSFEENIIEAGRASEES